MTENSALRVCADCGRPHTDLPTDWGFRLPDEVHALSYIQAYQRSRSNADLCCLDESRYFIRGVLDIPFVDREGGFAFGLWAEVSQDVHDAYVHDFNDNSVTPPSQGRLANDVQIFPSLLGERVDIKFMGERSRPFLWFPETSVHPLAQLQRVGIDRQRHHAWLEQFGWFDSTE